MGTQEAPDYLPDASWGLLGYLRFFHASKSSVSAMRSRMTSNMRASFPVVECGGYVRQGFRLARVRIWSTVAYRDRAVALRTLRDK